MSERNTLEGVELKHVNQSYHLFNLIKKCAIYSRRYSSDFGKLRLVGSIYIAFISNVLKCFKEMTLQTLRK